MSFKFSLENMPYEYAIEISPGKLGSINMYGNLRQDYFFRIQVGRDKGHLR